MVHPHDPRHAQSVRLPSRWLIAKPGIEIEMLWDWWWRNVAGPVLIGFFLVLVYFAVAALRKELTDRRLFGLLLVFSVGSFPNIMITLYGGVSSLISYFIPWTILFLCRNLSRLLLLLISVPCAVLLAALSQSYGYVYHDGIYLYPDVTLVKTVHGILIDLWTSIPLMFLGAYLLKPGRAKIRNGVR